MEKSKVFVIMPFSDDFFESYEMLKEHFQDDFEFSHAGDEDNQQNILADIISPIYAADVILADLTGLNPNVMYELGLAHSFNKKTIIITRDDLGKLPFDLKQYRAKDYSTHFKKFFDLIVEDVAKLLDKLFRGDRRIGNDTEFSKKVVLVDENEMQSIMMGFPTVVPLSREIASTYIPVLLNQRAAIHYIDVAQEYGLAGDVCPMPEAEAGVSIDDDAPILGCCAVQCNTTCDGSLLSNGVISKRMEFEDGIPVFQLAAPLRHTNDDVQDYAAQEIRNAIAFIEEHTGEKWDWKYYFECAKRVNYATKCRLEWLEMSKSPYPQVFGSNLALYTETNYMAISGRLPVFEETDRKIMKLAEKAYKKKKMAANEYRHRAIVWGVQSHFYMDFLVWLLNCWGIVPLTDMLSMDNTKMIAEEDTPENREQAIYDIAMLTEKMIMRNRTHGGYKVLLDDLWEFVNEFNADMVILWEHMSCKALDGMHGLFEERARELGIHLVWVSHDLFDPRVVNRQGVRDQINNYMRTVMGEEPVDPSLEILKDDESW